MQLPDSLTAQGFRLLSYHDVYDSGETDENQKDILEEKIVQLSNQIKTKFELKARERVVPKSRDALTSANYQAMKTIVSGMQII